jgi:glutamate dehydrogenase
MKLIDGSPSILLRNITQIIEKNNTTDNSSLMKKFAELLYGNISSNDLAHRNESDMYGATLSLWNELNTHQGSTPVINVFNPQVSLHGWKSSHSIIEVIVRDIPFLVDSIRIALRSFGLSPHFLLNCPIKIVRNSGNQITQLSATADDNLQPTSIETVFFIEIDRQNDQTVLDNIAAELLSVVGDVSLSVNDCLPLKNRLGEVITQIKKLKSPCSNQEKIDSLELLQWMLNDNFTLMGYRSYDVTAVEGDIAFEANAETSLGLMKNSDGTKQRLTSTLSECGRDIALGKNLLILTKTNARSRVHRPVQLDYIGIKRFNDEGNVIGEDRFIGLFGSAYYTSSALEIPLIKCKVLKVLNNSTFTEGSYDYKALINILETYPRDEILQSNEDELLKNVLGILQMQERNYSRLFLRNDNFGRFYSCMVYVPRDRYNTQLRVKTQLLLQKVFGSEEEVEFTTYFSESVQARTHYIVRVKTTEKFINIEEIENDLNEAVRSWDDKLADALQACKGESEGNRLTNKYINFPQAYKDEVTPGIAIADIEKFETLSNSNRLEMLFYQSQEEKPHSRNVKLKLFHTGEPLHLSDVVPMLENFGLRIIGESPYAINTTNNDRYWILDFSMLLTGEGKFELENSQHLFQNAFEKVWNGELEDDGFNRLIIGACLGGREVSILRALAKYEHQIGGTFSQSYIEDTFARYPVIAELLIKLFTARFDPKLETSEKTITRVLQTIETALDHVTNLDDDRIIRRFVEMIQAIVRTNYFQPDPVKGQKSYISFKFLPQKISDIPKPVPLFEIFVYSPQVEGVHRRGGKIARGGLRWSDRREDFRTEVLGLVKAQQVKNSVIVPVGAKGGFVCKQLPKGSRQDIFEAGKECYRTFIRGLLDITDNIVAGEVLPPENVVRFDENDPYLVVAADKGTATFSDIANDISKEYNFWMGDAFASGGSVGYDHKGMGITAKGAWESVKRHFREIGIDCQNTDFTCMAIGDMAGDVFGNGMLLSKNIRLQAAFNHLHIFIDPTPDAASSYIERERLFNLPGCSWEDYNTKLISAGGGIFLRSAKSIKLTPQIQTMLSTQKKTMAPIELMKLLLKMNVDLFWNGGIGTYVKGTKESHADVGDRANDTLRINGNELNAKIVGEGGNLGLTQLGRIEYALRGGLLNADSVDNVGGVDCSDNEVNIKILLNTLVQEGDLTVKQRNQLLYDMTDEVGEIVLEDCYRQTHSLSITALGGVKQLKEQNRFIHQLEKVGKLDRELEFIPNDDEILERLAQEKGFTRPELSVLLAYSKMVLKEDLIHTEVTDNPFHNHLLVEAFPKQLHDKYQTRMQEHPLRSEIIATKLANKISNDMGFDFVIRMQEETGASVAEIANSYTIASALFEMEKTWEEITQLDNKVAADIQSDMLFQLRHNVRRVTRWFIQHRDKTLTLEDTIAFYRPTFVFMAENLNDLLVEEEVNEVSQAAQSYIKSGVPVNISQRIAQLSSLFPVMDIADISKSHNRTESFVAKVFFKLGVGLDIHWFLFEIDNQPVANYWQGLAIASFREDLDWQQRLLTISVLRWSVNYEESAASLVVHEWISINTEQISRWMDTLTEFRVSQANDFAMFSVAMRELMLLGHNCDST